MLIDFIFLVLMIIACIKGFRKGFIIALFSVIAFIVGLAAAIKLSAVVAGMLQGHFNSTGKWLPVISFLLVFVLVAWLVNLGATMIQKTFEAVMLGWINRLAGAAFYMVLYSIIYSFFLFYATQLELFKATTLETSRLYAHLYPLAPAVMNGLGSVIPLFKDLFGQLERFFDQVSNKMQH